MKENQSNGESLDLSISLKRYKDEIKDFSSGYFILFDIIDSTSRKDEHKYRWIQQTKLLYSATLELKSYLNKVLGFKESFIKNLGDSTFIFFPYEKNKDLDKTHEIFKSVLEFKETFRSNERITDDLKIKVVLTYLNDIFLFKKEGSSDIIDVIGKGIDFSFRLEKFGGSEYIITNTLFHDSLTSKISDVFNTVEIKRKIKGWEDKGRQLFYAIYSKSSLSGESIPIGEEISNINGELLRQLLK